MNNKIMFGIGGVIIGIILVLLLSNTGGYQSMMYGNDFKSNNMMFGNRSANMSLIDQHFIEQMIPHHDGAIAMANLALEKSKRPEIKTLAKAIVSAQESENQQMKSWYRDWFGKDVSKGSAMTGGMMSQGGMHMGGTQDIEALKNAPDFDKAFIEAMIPHHQLAIMMANMLQSGTSRPEMQGLAKNIIKSQSKEIEQMQSWYKNWYK